MMYYCNSTAALRGDSETLFILLLLTQGMPEHRHNTDKGHTGTQKGSVCSCSFVFIFNSNKQKELQLRPVNTKNNIPISAFTARYPSKHWNTDSLIPERNQTSVSPSSVRLSNPIRGTYIFCTVLVVSKGIQGRFERKQRLYKMHF